MKQFKINKKLNLKKENTKRNKLLTIIFNKINKFNKNKKFDTFCFLFNIYFEFK